MSDFDTDHEYFINIYGYIEISVLSSNSISYFRTLTESKEMHQKEIENLSTKYQVRENSGTSISECV